MATNPLPTLVELAPNFSIYTHSEREARHIHKEIYIDECYAVPSSLLLSLDDRPPIIIDAGANIGLFTLWARSKFPSANILAFEPVPQTFDVLRKNLALHRAEKDKEVEAFCCGLGGAEAGGEGGTVELTFYPNAPGNSTRFPEQKDGLKELVKERFPEHGEKVIEGWLGKEEKVQVEVRTLSSFLVGLEEKQGGLFQSIDLLKVDVEGAEFEVLDGLDECHWKLVRNIVLEISEIQNQGALKRMVGLLEKKGFEVNYQAAHPDWSKDIFVVKARRPEL